MSCRTRPDLPLLAAVLSWGTCPIRSREHGQKKPNHPDQLDIFEVEESRSLLGKLFADSRLYTTREGYKELVRLSTREWGVELKLPLVGRERKRLMAQPLVRQINSNKNPTR